MDSRLDSIFRTTFRQTESADTWMGIRREEPRDDHKRRKHDDDAQDQKATWEDDTSVSLAALKQFLSMLIAPESGYQAPEPEPVISVAVPTQVNLSAQQQRAHIAARAYQATARHAPPPTSQSTSQPTSPPPPVQMIPASPAASSSNTLTAEENRIIHQLLNDLDILMQNGIGALTIQKEGTFLESLQRAARRTLDAIT